MARPASSDDSGSSLIEQTFETYLGPGGHGVRRTRANILVWTVGLCLAATAFAADPEATFALRADRAVVEGSIAKLYEILSPHVEEIVVAAIRAELRSQERCAGRVPQGRGVAHGHDQNTGVQGAAAVCAAARAGACPLDAGTGHGTGPDAPEGDVPRAGHQLSGQGYLQSKASAAVAQAAARLFALGDGKAARGVRPPTRASTGSRAGARRRVEQASDLEGSLNGTGA